MSQHAAPTIHDLQQLDERRRAQLLLGRDEDQWFDRKTVRVAATTVADVLVGMANAQGGLVLIGIEKGRLDGIDGLTREINEWTQAGVDFTEPTVPNRLVQLRCDDGKGRGRFVALIEVSAGDRLYKNRRGEVLLRVGDETKHLTAEQAQQLAYEKGAPHFDGTLVPDATRADLDPDVVRAYVAQLPAPVYPRTALEARGFLQKDRAGALRPTVGGLLLFGRRPQAKLPSARVRVIQYRGRTREVGQRMNVVDDVSFDGPLITQINAARGHIRAELPEAIQFDPDYGRFTSLPLIPEEAWEEAVTNAVLHRSYALGGDHIRVEIFSDRLEVTSPGRLPGPVSIKNISTTRYARNPSIARALTEMRYARELAEGVRRMFAAMENAGFARPLLDEGPATFKVTFLFESAYSLMIDALPQGADRLVAHLVQSAGRVTTGEATSLLGVTKPTALKVLRKLAASGLLVRQEQNPNDPTGLWQVVAHPSGALRRPPPRGRRSRASTLSASSPRSGSP